MPKYRVHGTVKVYVSTVVEARGEAEAVGKAGGNWAGLIGLYNDKGDKMIGPLNPKDDAVDFDDDFKPEWEFAFPRKAGAGPEETDSEEILFILAADKMAGKVHETALSRGWWDSPRTDGEVIALCHSELSEALEALRRGNPPDDKIPEFSGAEAELADAIIRILDFGKERGWRIPEALVAKNYHNLTRPYRHGKAF